MSPLHFQHIPYRSFPSFASGPRSSNHPRTRSSPTCSQNLQAIPRSAATSPELLASLVREGKICRREQLRPTSKKPSAIPRHIVQEINQRQKRDTIKKRASSPTDELFPAIDTIMSPHSSTKHSPSSSKASSPGASSSSSTTSPSSSHSKKGKHSKEVDWADVTDPEERRRIQNRIAQRKFREKARENREKAEREMRNQEHAGNSYRTPTADDFMHDGEPAGLPWGSVNFGHILTRGHDLEGRRSSGRGTYVGEDPYRANYYAVGYGHGVPQAASYHSSGTEDAYLEEPAYVYSPVLQTFPPPIGPQ